MSWVVRATLDKADSASLQQRGTWLTTEQSRTELSGKATLSKANNASAERVQ